jgi:dTDP-glucose pyrophosphorylase
MLKNSGDGSSFGVGISSIHQYEPKGIAHAIGLNEFFHIINSK